MWALIESIFLTAKFYSHGWETCKALKSSTLDGLKPLCVEMMGYMPTYRQMIEPRELVSVFDEVLVDLQQSLDEHYIIISDGAQRYSPNILEYGICNVRDDMISRNFISTEWRDKVHGKYIGNSTLIFKLEGLANIGKG